MKEMIPRHTEYNCFKIKNKKIIKLKKAEIKRQLKISHREKTYYRKRKKERMTTDFLSETI